MATVLLIAIHEVYVNAWLHRWPQLVEQSGDPRNIRGSSDVSAQVASRLMMKGALRSPKAVSLADLCLSPAKIGEFNRR